MAQDVLHLGTREARVDGDENAARGRDAEVRFQHRRAVREECRDAVALRETGGPERAREAPRALAELRIGVPPLAVRDRLLPRVHEGGPLEEVDRIHLRAEHPGARTATIHRGAVGGDLARHDGSLYFPSACARASRDAVERRSTRRGPLTRRQSSSSVAFHAAVSPPSSGCDGGAASPPAASPRVSTGRNARLLALEQREPRLSRLRAELRLEHAAHAGLRRGVELQRDQLLVPEDAADRGEELRFERPDGDPRLRRRSGRGRSRRDLRRAASEPRDPRRAGTPRTGVPRWSSRRARPTRVRYANARRARRRSGRPPSGRRRPGPQSESAAAPAARDRAPRPGRGSSRRGPRGGTTDCSRRTRGSSSRPPRSAGPRGRPRAARRLRV